jgi:hypothetical protein
MKKVLLLTALCLATVVLAATETPLNVKPGLWQVDMTLAYSGLPPNMQAMVDRMTPEQRAARGFGGIKTFKRCVTPKQLNTPWMQGDENCTWTVLKSTDSTLEVRGTACRLGSDQGMNTDVKVKIQVIDSEHVTASIHGTASGNGVNATLNGDYDGKWVGASCPSH